MPIPGKSEGSKIGCVDTDTVPGLIAGESLLFGLVVLSGISGMPGLCPGFTAGRDNPVGLPRLPIPAGNRLSLSGLGAMSDCAFLRGIVLRMLGLVF